MTIDTYRLNKLLVGLAMVMPLTGLGIWLVLHIGIGKVLPYILSFLTLIAITVSVLTFIRGIGLIIESTLKKR